MPANRISLAAIMSRKGVPVNSQWSVRDFRKYMGKSRGARRQSGLPSIRSLIAAKGASILAHFSRPDIGLEMDPVIVYPYPRFAPIERTPLIPDGRSASSGCKWGNLGQPTTTSWGNGFPCAFFASGIYRAPRRVKNPEPWPDVTLSGPYFSRVRVYATRVALRVMAPLVAFYRKCAHV